ncbi:hypothetical protein DFP72DRAFT_941814 [Ephemerocybe angulata]|uniref:Rad4-domain-containing protein n=1 Tax=Ephemerocybe angulata TaxID=980116 RepID=A0A8H6H903_9AGAR|nr:hypothetical protein DFP72DRAFT_941814 [Tulosesus angulatus]
MSSDVEMNPFDQEVDSEDEGDWEEVNVPPHLDVDIEPVEQHIEIILKPLASSAKGKKKAEDENKKKGITHEERLMRINVHKIHTVVLLANAKMRNRWINDEILQARLMSLTPITLQNEFAQIHPSRIPDKGQRGRMFEKALQHLASWWSGTFFDVLPSGHIRNRTFDEVQSKLLSYGVLYEEEDLDDDTLEGVLGCEIERIRGPKSLMKHALNRSGSRDVSAQLFTSLCRALGIPARLVVSLQSVPWQPSVGKPKPTYSRKDAKGKGKAKGIDNDGTASSTSVDIKGKGRARSPFDDGGRRLDGRPVPKSEKAKGKQRAEPVIKLRKQKDKGRKLGSSTPSASTSRLASPDPVTTPPVFWTEVFSRPDARWMPVDPVRGLVNKRKAFDPTPTPTYHPPAPPTNTGSLLPPRPPPLASNYYSFLPKGTRQENRMLYVMAFEEDGYARDVTRRYAREYNAKIAKNQGGSNAANTGGKARSMWWENVCNLVKRPFQLHRDDLEDDELTANQMKEGMPSTISGFKDHPLYVLTRHLKQTEVIHPPPPDTPEIGKFRGEPVYPRSSVVPLKSAETWMRTEGRIVKAGCQPLKTIKARPGTVNRLRELEVMKDELRDAGHSAEGVEVMQGLYARSQTELYVPPPVVDGKIPKNDFGNIDLYAPTMLPRGAVHVPFKGTAKIARKLGFDFAEAVTGFEFRKRRANAVIEGIVVAAENEAALLEAFWEHQRAEDEKARNKKEEKALQHWIKLVSGLRIRQRLQAEYADRGTPTKSAAASGSKASGKKRAAAKRSGADLNSSDVEMGGENGAGEARSVNGDGDGDEVHLEDRHGEGHGGGFLVEADDVVQAFNLPKYNPLILESSNNLFSLGSKNVHGKRRLGGKGGAAARGEGEGEGRVIDYATYDLEEHEEPPVSDGTMDVDMEGALGEPLGMGEALEGFGEDVPRTMQELLDAEKQLNGASKEEGDDVIVMGEGDGAKLAEVVSSRLRLRLPAKAGGGGVTPSPVTRSARPSRSASAMKRKRDEREDEESDEGEQTPWEGEDEDAVDDGVVEDGGLEDESDVDNDPDDAPFGSKKKTKGKSQAKAPTRKKAKGAAGKPKPKPVPRTPRMPKTKATPVPTPPTDRVLRSRGPKAASSS